MEIKVPVNTINIKANTYTNCTNITAVDLSDIVWVDYNMFNAFHNCVNVTQVTNINSTTTNMAQTFQNCYKLNVTPTLPISVTNLTRTFYFCNNITTAPTIPNSVINMWSTFDSCVNLTAIPTIPSNVTNMCSTFNNCPNINADITIPQNVTDVYSCFRLCSNFASNITIKSTNITNANKFFEHTTATKNVYIPFYNLYSNKANTTTYTSFTAAGYKTDGSKEGVYLKNSTPTLTINPTPSDATIRYTVGGNVYTQKSIAVPYQTTVAYAVTKSGYVTKAQTFTIGTTDQTLNVTISPEHPDTVTLSIITDPVDATVTFSTGTVSGKSCTIPYGTSVTYTISRTGYKTSDPVTVTLTEDQVIPAPSLEKNNYKLTISTNPTDAIVTFDTSVSGGTVEGKSITVPYNTQITYSVSRTGYQSKNNLTYTVTSTETVPAPALDKNNYTFTVNTTPNDATVNFSTGTVSGHSVTVPYNTTITYTISKTGYITSQPYTKTVTQNDSVNAPALVEITDPNYEFVIVNDKANLTKYIGTAIDITVPDSVGTI